MNTHLESLDWPMIEAALMNDGFALLPRLLARQTCQQLAALYADESHFRSRIVMQRYAFGQGEYQYFRYPMPALVDNLRSRLYERLAPVANRWHAALKINQRFPDTHVEFKAICHQAGQCRPTPLMLRYRQDDYTCLHQDLYGEQVFPFQVVFLLDQPGLDFEGGEFVLTHTGSSKPARAEVVPLEQGQALIFAVNSRPERSARGFCKVSVRHGVSRLHRGERHTLGIIFHDAK
ncbi:proline hydroxylase [Pseudomonas sp. KBS0710]|uniref:2OG-Fe(II) oxygenase n=1 Tax=Pseudomonas sp. KBS0710 TaxID=1179667 RepID=UPI00110DF6C2|nr:2OG-Fe(II) oxygenase [Pseudomonas sp. KBS0710]TSD76955.1 proline hydroxylase [Pseudomonas sp. KBS0710]